MRTSSIRRKKSAPRPFPPVCHYRLSPLRVSICPGRAPFSVRSTPEASPLPQTPARPKPSPEKMSGRGTRKAKRGVSCFSIAPDSLVYRPLTDAPLHPYSRREGRRGDAAGGEILLPGSVGFPLSERRIRQPGDQIYTARPSTDLSISASIMHRPVLVRPGLPRDPSSPSPPPYLSHALPRYPE